MSDLERFAAVSRFHFIECSGNTLTEWREPTLETVQGTHGLTSASEWIRRTTETIDTSDCRKRYQRLDLSEIDLGYAGRLPHEHPALAGLQRLSAGDRVGLKREGERFLIVNDDGHVVGRLAKKYLPPDGLRFLEGRVFAIVTRKEDDSADEFRGGLRRASWEVLVPELVFGPDG